MILITPAECRAARALLNWSQPDLAERCDMHVQTIKNANLSKVMRRQFEYWWKNGTAPPS